MELALNALSVALADRTLFKLYSRAMVGKNNRVLLANHGSGLYRNAGGIVAYASPAEGFPVLP